MKIMEQYENRYGDLFTFTYDPKTETILWEGNFKYCRYGWEPNTNFEDNRYNMVDPSGGPYISSGTQSDLIVSAVKGLYVDYMSIAGPSVNIHLKQLPK